MRLDAPKVYNERAVSGPRTRVIEEANLRVPVVDIHTVGAGGGSIAWIDAAAALNVGPTSAGSFPGPACYDRGGAEPTAMDN